MNRIFATFFLVSLLFCISCTARISGSLQRDGQADLQIYAALEPRMTMLISGLAAASGAMNPGAAILDGPAIAASMSAAPGVASASFKNATPSAIEGPVKISRISDFLSGNVSGNAPGFLIFEQSSTGGRCAINLNLNSGPEMLTLISPDIDAYLGALMAPLSTGEAMTKTEYRELVGSVYGRGIADEISKAFINASIDFPGQVQSVKGGTFSGRRAEFAIPLLDVLVLETPLNYEVMWR